MLGMRPSGPGLATSWEKMGLVGDDQCSPVGLGSAMEHICEKAPEPRLRNPQNFLEGKSVCTVPAVSEPGLPSIEQGGLGYLGSPSTHKGTTRQQPLAC